MSTEDDDSLLVSIVTPSESGSFSVPGDCDSEIGRISDTPEIGRTKGIEGVLIKGVEIDELRDTGTSGMISGTGLRDGTVRREEPCSRVVDTGLPTEIGDSKPET